jgi:hypothetical protein
MDHDQLVATFTLTARQNGLLELRVQHADGSWNALSLERVMAPGWRELKFLWREMAAMIEGDLELPF